MRTPRIIWPMVRSIAKRPNSLPRLSSPFACMMHSARLCSAGSTPAPKLLSEVKTVKAAALESGDERETRTCDSRSTKSDVLSSPKSNRISAAIWAGVCRGFFFPWAVIETADGLGLGLNR